MARNYWIKCKENAFCVPRPRTITLEDHYRQSVLKAKETLDLV